MNKLILYLLLSITFISSCKVEKESKSTSKLIKDEGAFRFFIMGDWGRNGKHNQQTVADRMGEVANKFSPEFILNMGDNFYCCGVKDVNDPQWKSSFENVYKAKSLNIPWYGVLGNHDYKGSVQAQIDYSKKSARWKMPARYYTFEEKGVRFVFIDTNPFVKKYISNASEYPDILSQDKNIQLKWIDSVLSNSKEEWKIVIGHHPVYSTGIHGNQQELIDLLKPVLEKNNVQIYFCGHDHDLQYQKPENSKVNYFVSGAGSEYRPNIPNTIMTKFAKSTPGFMAASLKNDSLSMYAIDGKGNIIYNVKIPKAEK